MGAQSSAQRVDVVSFVQPDKPCVGERGSSVTQQSTCKDEAESLEALNSLRRAQTHPEQLQSQIAQKRRSRGDSPPCSASSSSTISRQPRDVADVRPRSILKKGVGIRDCPTKQVPVRGILRRAEQGAVARLCAKWRPWRRVHFECVAQVAVYERQLGGSGSVPTDGSTVALGLGQRVPPPVQKLDGGATTASKRPSRSQAFFREPVRWEQRGPRPVPRYFTPQERSRYLRAAMGDAKFFHAMAKHRKEIQQLIRCRQEVLQVPTDFKLMAKTLKDAKARAEQVAPEAKDHCEEQRLAALDSLRANRKRSATFQKNPVGRLKRRRSNIGCHGITCESAKHHSKGSSSSSG